MIKRSVLQWLYAGTVMITAVQVKAQSADPAAVRNSIEKVNDHWQSAHTAEVRSFWDNAAYQTGNMEVWALTGKARYAAYATAWANYNQWMGAKSKNKEDWKYTYGESEEYVLFGDYQACFQTYIDLYNLKPDPRKLARVREVMDYQISTPRNDYWWWCDGLYMVMPVLTKLYKVTGNRQYLNKLYQYITYSDSIMYDNQDSLYYRDARYTYPKHSTLNGKKDFWARGDGWVLAALAKVIKDLPADYAQRGFFIRRFQAMAYKVAALQQPEGYWTRSLLDPQHAPGPETSGTAFFTYGLLWGINNGYLDKTALTPVIQKAWRYLEKTALQKDGSIGYVQPIGDRAIPDQQINASSTAAFGVGAWLLAACEYVRYLEAGKARADHH